MKTRDELHIAFKMEIDKNGQATAFGGAPGFLDEEIDYWIDQAVYQVVNNKFSGNNSVKIPFELSVKRISDLANLVTEQTLQVVSKTYSNELVTASMPADYMYFVSGLLQFGTELASIQLMNHVFVDKFRKTYDNDPYMAYPMAVIEDDGIHMFIDTHTMEADSYSLQLTYVKQPTKIEDYPEEGLQEFPDYMYDEIINRAALLALEDIESQRQQSKSQLNQVNE